MYVILVHRKKCCAVWVQAGKIYNNKLSPSRDKNPLLVISRISQTCYSRILAVNFISRNELLKKSAEGSAKSREESRFVELMQCVNGNAWAVRRPTVDVWNESPIGSIFAAIIYYFTGWFISTDFSRPRVRAGVKSIFSHTGTANPRNVLLITLYFGIFHRGIDWCQPRFVR